MEHLNLSGRHIMTILNITPDSFFEGSRTPQRAAIADRVREAVAAGATIIDVGGYSSRPGADDVSMEEEWQRVELGVSVVREVAPEVAISVDTFRSEVARRVVEQFGRVVINDITAGEADDEMFGVVAKYELPYVAMHMRGTPQSMQSMVSYDNVVDEVVEYFKNKITELKKAGVKEIILDPGFGFAKSVEQNYELMKGLSKLCDLGYPVLVGVSRKSMIYKVLESTPDDALAGTIALNWESLRQGATILRVHDTHEAVQTLRIFEKYNEA
ncbi:MAG: dihydropteroate synthase [Rikenellaceae bacterium]